MIEIDLPFYVTGRPSFAARASRSAAFERRQTNEIILQALSISIETMGKTYSISSQASAADGAMAVRGAAWLRRSVPLTEGISIEQQMVLPVDGDALAVCWRLIGGALLPVRLTVSPVFSAHAPMSDNDFEIEPETNGGRLAWRPYSRSSKIIADTNGRCNCGVIARDFDLGKMSQPTNQFAAIPVSFDFDLGPQPSVLIFSVEPHKKVARDPIIGGFLAQMVEQRSAISAYDRRRNLAAA